ncbi:hypothetical protein [Kitasatospora sp. SolWspMP-SS2h]|uniref:hypothetical protein n=1 Tax=Kitasatospora sp. SolWspMP-SS2h TaxID=1305729 RepID=UPI0011B93D62|nr:hypothetical protein [Kitasatospora sp. SolWspMP-SS2h]
MNTLPLEVPAGAPPAAAAGLEAPGAEAEAAAEPDGDADPDAETEADAEADTDPEADAEAEVEAEGDAEAERLSVADGEAVCTAPTASPADPLRGSSAGFAHELSARAAAAVRQAADSTVLRPLRRGVFGTGIPHERSVRRNAESDCRYAYHSGSGSFQPA